MGKNGAKKIINLEKNAKNAKKREERQFVQ